MQEKVGQLRQWVSNAPSYESRHQELDELLRPVADWLSRRAGLEPGMRLLDLACGSGLPAMQVAKLVRPDGRVIATDLAPDMVAATQRQALANHVNNADFAVIDAEALAFAPESFDAVTCQLGFMFCVDPHLAIRESRRVLKPGGRLVAAVWSKPEDSPGQIGPHQSVIAETLRRLGRESAPLDYEVAGQFQLAPEGKFEALLNRAELRNVLVERIVLQRQYTTFDDFLGAVSEGPLKPVLEHAAQRDRALEHMREVLEPYTYEGQIQLPMTLLCASAVK